MSLPDTPLKFNFNPEEMTLDELCLFEPEGFTATGFRAFLITHTNWTKKDIGQIKVAELKSVAEQLGEKLKAATVPLVK